jgi:hypothetical protein
MIWGKSIFPHFHVNAPMPFAVREPASTPDAVPKTITAAINKLLRAHDIGNDAFWREARDELDAVILKHLRGEA